MREHFAREEEVARADDALHVVAVDELDLTDAHEQQSRHGLALVDDDLAWDERLHREASDDLLADRLIEALAERTDGDPDERHHAVRGRAVS